MRTLLVISALIAIVSGSAFTSANCASFCSTLDYVCGATFNNSALGGIVNGGYSSSALCLASCAALSAVPGYAGDTTNTTGNTLGCRMYHLGVAAVNSSNAAIHCPHVSLTSAACVGASAAIDRCTTYCTLQNIGCPETFEAVLGTPSSFQFNICIAACAGSLAYGVSPQQGGYYMGGAEGGAATPYATGGDSVQCRTYHTLVATFSGGTANTTHCPHAAPLGGDVCGNTTTAMTAFCTNTMGVCSLGGNLLNKTGLWPYSSFAQCMSDSATYNQSMLNTQFGAVNAASGDSLGCRGYHGGIPAITDPVTHCPHTGWASAPCGARTATTQPSATTVAPTTKGAASAVASVALVAAALAALF